MSTAANAESGSSAIRARLQGSAPAADAVAKSIHTAAPNMRLLMPQLTVRVCRGGAHTEMSKERYSSGVSEVTMTGTSLFDGIRPGLRGESEFVVTEAMTTSHVGGRQRVMTTPVMIMQMEETAQEVTRPFLPPDHTTVGYEIVVRHRAAAPLGTRVRVSAELIAADGRKLQFRVEARAGTETVGEGTLRRTIIRLGALDESQR